MSPSRRLPPLAALRAFEAAARHLSFTRAAEELHVTQAAVSHQIRQLEEDLGVRLFRRLSRALRLTEAGQLLAPFLQDGFALLHAGVDRVRSAAQGSVLTVTAPPSFAASWLVPRLVQFQRRHPGIEVRLVSTMRKLDLFREGIDVGVRYGRGAWPGLIAERLMTDDLFPVCAPGLLDETGGGPPALSSVQLLHVQAFPDDWPRWLAATGVGSVDAERGSWFDTAGAAYEAAAAGLGVAMGRRQLVADALADGRLVAPFATALPAEVAYYLVLPPEHRGIARIEAFCSWLRDAAGVSPAIDREIRPPKP